MSYEKFVTNYRRYTHCARTFDEAFRTADYAQSIWRCESENENGWNKAVNWLIPIAIIAGFIFIAVPTIEWIINK